MAEHVVKTAENTSKTANTEKTGKNKNTLSLFTDNRQEALLQRQMNKMVNQSIQAKPVFQSRSIAGDNPDKTLQLKEIEEEELLQGKFMPVQKTENDTGIPDNLKAGIEQHSGLSMDDVKVHYNSEKPSQLQAHAYAQGTDIYLAAGQEKHLPHEAWHVVQQKQGRVKPTKQLAGKVKVNDNTGLEKEADVMGEKVLTEASQNKAKLHANHYGDGFQKLTPGSIVIQRAIKGTYAALVAVEPEKGFRFGKTHGTWTDLLQAVAEYELIEAKPAPSGNVKNHKKHLKELLEGLKKIEKYAVQWIEKHEATVITRPGVDDTMKTGDMTNVSDADKSDLSQLSSARNLLRRIAWERNNISLYNPKTTVFSDSAMTAPAVDNAVGGQASKLDEVHFGGKGYYQPDAIKANVTDSAAAATGIPGFDPNWSGRSMAAARIDQLLTSRFASVAQQAQAPSLVKMNFASHTRIPFGEANAVPTTGVLLEEAIGSEMRKDLIDQNLAIRDETSRAQNNVNQIAMDDPVLQRSLNRLQLLDALCGQVDRHMGNLFVSQDITGQVTGVQGIDNDMAFGSKMKGDNFGLRAQAKKGVSEDLIGEKRAWKGLPPIADEEVAMAILSIRPEDIIEAVSGLIAPHEINATIDRLNSTQQFLKSLPPNMLIKPNEWDARRTELGNKQQAFNSYLGAARTEALGILTTPAQSVKGIITQEMENRQPSSPENRRNNAVAEWIFAESAILSDIQNLISRGEPEAQAINKGKALARNYATRITFPNIDRRQMSYKEAMATVNIPACAEALELARRTMYSIWG